MFRIPKVKMLIKVKKKIVKTFYYSANICLEKKKKKKKSKNWLINYIFLMH